MFARENSPVSVLPSKTPVASRGKSVALGKTGVGQRARRHVQSQPVREVRRAKRAADDAEADAVELVAFDHRGLDGVGASRARCGSAEQ